MVFILIVLFIAAANIAGCILIKKRGIQIFLGIAAWIWVLIALAGGLLLYNINCKVTDIDVSESLDGAHELHFQQIGEPDWPFGSTHARLALEDKGRTVTTCNFDIANDGKNLGPENWEATWGNNHASAAIFGEEQNDYRYNLSFDGKIEELQLDTYNGKTIPNAQNETPKPDEDGYPTTQDYQAYKREMTAVANYLGLDKFDMEYKITAKGYPYAVISRETNDATGQVTELRIILNEQHSELSTSEYVLQKHQFAPDGTESASAEIVDFYLVDCATLKVTDEHSTQWH